MPTQVAVVSLAMTWTGGLVLSLAFVVVVWWARDRTLRRTLLLID